MAWLNHSTSKYSSHYLPPLWFFDQGGQTATTANRKVTEEHQGNDNSRMQKPPGKQVFEA